MSDTTLCSRSFFSGFSFHTVPPTFPTYIPSVSFPFTVHMLSPYRSLKIIVKPLNSSVMQKTNEKKNLPVVLHSLWFYLVSFTYERTSLTLLQSHPEVVPHEIVLLFYMGFLLRLIPQIPDLENLAMSKHNQFYKHHLLSILGMRKPFRMLNRLNF